MALFVESFESLEDPCSGRSEEMMRVVEAAAAFVIAPVTARLAAAMAAIAVSLRDIFSLPEETTPSSRPDVVGGKSMSRSNRPAKTF